MIKADDVKRLDAIIDGASQLPVENQEYILAAIKGMLFTRNLLDRRDKKEPETKSA